MSGIGCRGEPDSTLVRASDTIVLDSESVEHADRDVVHADGDSDRQFPSRVQQNLTHLIVDLEQIVRLVEIGVGGLEHSQFGLQHRVPPRDRHAEVGSIRSGPNCALEDWMPRATNRHVICLSGFVDRGPVELVGL